METSSLSMKKVLETNFQFSG